MILICSIYLNYITGLDNLKNYNMLTNVWLKSVAIFSGALYILHHYDSNFAHFLAFKNLVIEFLNAKR